MKPSSIAQMGEKQRQDAYQKYQIIEPYINGTSTLTAVAAKKGVPIRTQSLWLKKYRQFRLVGLARRDREDKGMPRKYDNQLKDAIEGLFTHRTSRGGMNVN